MSSPQASYHYSPAHHCSVDTFTQVSANKHLLFSEPDPWSYGWSNGNASEWNNPFNIDRLHGRGQPIVDFQRQILYNNHRFEQTKANCQLIGHCHPTFLRKIRHFEWTIFDSIRNAICCTEHLSQSQNKKYLKYIYISETEHPTHSN